MKVNDHNTVSTRVQKQEPTHDENRDLGFGSVVASESKQRLLNRDGTFNVMRGGLGFWTSLSPYHTLLNASWGRFLAFVGAVHLLVNLTFACAYLLCGRGALDGPEDVVFGNAFLRAFFFSVETFSTIGYGNVTPRGVPANFVVMAESFVSVLFVALATGLIFARFSRPTAKILFSRNAVVAPYRGITAFMFRVTNARNNSIMELQATVLLARFENVNGRLLRQFYPLSLERERVSLFPLSWTVVHAITEDSPLQGLAREELIESNAEVLILLKGIDETFSQQVHARSSYKADEIVWNARFGDIYDRTADTGLLTVDIRKLNDIEPL
jgi:inward rectifier potassium channel